MSGREPIIAVLGLGEAGGAIAADLAAGGARVLGWDPEGPEEPPGVEFARSEREAVEGAELVLSVNSAGAALAAAEAAAPALRPGHVYADLNTAAPALKREVAAVVEAAGAAFADVALIGPVPGQGVRTPALVSGAGAERFAELLGGFGMPVTPVGPEPGDAAARKLARSVFAKGLAAAVGEALAAAERVGCEEWLAADIERTLSGGSEVSLERLVGGSRRHARRRIEEMAAAVAMLEELGVEPRVASAAEAWLRALASSEVAR